MTAVRMWQAGEHPREDSGPTGGEFVKAGSGGASKASPAKAKAAPPKRPAPARRPAAPQRKPASGPAATGPYDGHTLAQGSKNDPRHVKQLQALLGGLKLGKVSASGNFDDATATAVTAAQKKLGMHATGHASASFIRKLQAAMTLSPCVGGSREASMFDLELRTTTETGYRRALGMCVRGFDFEAAGSSRDGRTLEGYAAVYKVRARIRAQGGDFDEEILPGAFAKSLEKRTQVMQWEHGQVPRVRLV